MKTFQITIAVLCFTLILSVSLSNCHESEESDKSEEQYDSVESIESNEESNEGSNEGLLMEESNESNELNDILPCHRRSTNFGVCTELEDCEMFLKRRNIYLNSTQRELIISTSKFCRPEDTDVVCCPIPIRTDIVNYSSLKNEILPSTESCGLVRVRRSFQKVVGGKDSEIGAWPWLAALAYDLFTRISYMCGGALVTERHVITAAHCMRETLVSVRLGEFDLSKNDETQHLDISIAKQITSNFDSKSGHNDLAILVLEKKVQFTDLISPICLPTSPELREKSYVDKKPFVAGWGHTKENGTMSAILQELQTTVLMNKVCYDGFKEQGILETEDQFDDSVICVGDIKGGKDTCQGDSGGPLMMPESIDGAMHYYLIGVVSRGLGCARKGLAGAYTNIPYHIDWILENLK